MQEILIRSIPTFDEDYPHQQKVQWGQAEYWHIKETGLRLKKEIVSFPLLNFSHAEFFLT